MRLAKNSTGSRALATVALVVSVTQTACSGVGEALPPEPVTLSTAQPHLNAEKIAALVKAVCLDAITNPADVMQAIATSGWAATRTQRAGPSTTLSVWKLDQGELIYSTIPMETSDKRGRDCSIHLVPEVSPTGEQMLAPLAEMTGQQRLQIMEPDMSNYYWQWRPGLFEEQVVTVNYAPTDVEGLNSKAGNVGLAIHVSNTEFTPIRSLFGS